MIKNCVHGFNIPEHYQRESKKKKRKAVKQQPDVNTPKHVNICMCQALADKCLINAIKRPQG